MKISFLKIIVILSILLLTLIPLSANAASSGTCGENLTWTLSSNGTLTISGTGKMTDFKTSPPWYANKDSIKSVILNKGITHIGNYAFNFHRNLTDVKIPDGVQTIGTYAFATCFNLKEIALPHSVTGIWSNAFYEANALTNVAMSENLTALGDMAFADCSSLKEIVIPDKITSIGRLTFANCTELTTVSIPKGIRTISEKAFYSCSKLKTVKYGGTPENRSSINIADGNDYLLKAEFQYIPSVDYIRGNSVFDVTPTNVQNGNTIVFACYNNNKMVYVHPFTYNGEKSITFSTTEAYDKVKFMVWENLKTCIPLCKTKEVPLN